MILRLLYYCILKSWISISLISLHIDPSIAAVNFKTCRGTNYRLSITLDEERYDFFKRTYTNCTMVDGNLEISFFGERHDTSFLNDIEEVTGYVLIAFNHFSDLGLRNLKIIRGMTLFREEGLDDLPFSLYVTNNHDSTRPGVGLKQLGLVSLKEILSGNIYLFNNRDLCFTTSVNWNDILPGERCQIYYNHPHDVNHQTSLPPAACDNMVCDKNCTFQGQRYCWGQGPDKCQRMTRLICSEQCDDRCYGTQISQCCHKECAVGCNGASNSNCFACKHFSNNGKCQETCPPEETYDKSKMENVKNPDVKYTFGSMCVEKCPKYLKKDKGTCVRECGAGRISRQNQCVDCGNNCPKVCLFTKEMGDWLDSINIKDLIDCHTIQGSLTINNFTFEGDKYRGAKGLKVSDLSVLESVREITGYLQISAMVRGLDNLQFLKNLRIIHGNSLLGKDMSSLSIFETSLKTFDLYSLEEIKYGNIYIGSNRNLCNVELINWKSFLLDDQLQVVRLKNYQEDCFSSCSNECSLKGCWGANNSQCFSCLNFKFGDQCISDCQAVPLTYQSDNSTCTSCHSECKGHCTDGGAYNCSSCLNAIDEGSCVAECSTQKYENSVTSECLPCHVDCGPYGCYNNSNFYGKSGCKSCDLVLLEEVYDLETMETSDIKCLSSNMKNCEDGYFKKFLTNLPEGHPLYKKHACQRCHPECSLCDEYGVSLSYCKECTNYVQDNKCVNQCSDGFYLDPINRICVLCDEHCLHCTGPTSSDCITCKQYVVYMDDQDETKFNCTSKCPDALPYKITKETETGGKLTVCVSDDGGEHGRKVKWIVIGTLSSFLILVIPIIIFIYLWWKRAKDKQRLFEQASKLLTGEVPTLKPSGIAPDTSTLLLISEDDLMIGEIMGSGAFGSVFKGTWLPKGGNPGESYFVAIKVLKADMTQIGDKDSLANEAQIMASVEHEHCIRILGICLGNRLMIVSQLMPYGSLHDFLIKYKDDIKAYNLLTWACQIAKGMAYLEEKHIVHRDLAARNVLVQNDNHVRITDFGLSKFLERNTKTIYSNGGKFPIKWLALESIKEKKFNHKTDVWSYGVTLWEMCTFGAGPYEDIDSRQVPEFLEKGQRLAQPQICTIDIFMVMIKCWLIDAESRPSFSTLVEIFTNMATDPTRYIFIENENERKLPLTNAMRTISSYSSSGGGENRSSRDLNISRYLEPTTVDERNQVSDTDRSSQITSSQVGGTSLKSRLLAFGRKRNNKKSNCYTVEPGKPKKCKRDKAYDLKMQPLILPSSAYNTTQEEEKEKHWKEHVVVEEEGDTNATNYSIAESKLLSLPEFGKRTRTTTNHPGKKLRNQKYDNNTAQQKMMIGLIKTPTPSSDLTDDSYLSPTSYNNINRSRKSHRRSNTDGYGDEISPAATVVEPYYLTPTPEQRFDYYPSRSADQNYVDATTMKNRRGSSGGVGGGGGVGDGVTYLDIINGGTYSTPPENSPLSSNGYFNSHTSPNNIINNNNNNFRNNNNYNNNNEFSTPSANAKISLARRTIEDIEKYGVSLDEPTSPLPPSPPPTTPWSPWSPSSQKFAMQLDNPSYFVHDNYISNSSLNRLRRLSAIEASNGGSCIGRMKKNNNNNNNKDDSLYYNNNNKDKDALFYNNNYNNNKDSLFYNNNNSNNNKDALFYNNNNINNNIVVNSVHTTYDDDYHDDGPRDQLSPGTVPNSSGVNRRIIDNNNNGGGGNNNFVPGYEFNPQENIFGDKYKAKNSSREPYKCANSPVVSGAINNFNGGDYEFNSRENIFGDEFSAKNSSREPHKCANSSVVPGAINDFNEAGGNNNFVNGDVVAGFSDDVMNENFFSRSSSSPATKFPSQKREKNYYNATDC